MMNRRDFMMAMPGLILAPAVVKAENLMKLWVPPTDIFMYYPYVQLQESSEAKLYNFVLRYSDPQKAARQQLALEAMEQIMRMN